MENLSDNTSSEGPIIHSAPWMACMALLVPQEAQIFLRDSNNLGQTIMVSFRLYLSFQTTH